MKLRINSFFIAIFWLYLIAEADGFWGPLLCAIFLAIAAGLFTAWLISRRYQPKLY